MVQERLSEIHESTRQELNKLKQLQKCRALKEPVLNARRLNLENRLIELNQEVDDILMENLRYKKSTLDTGKVFINRP